MKKTIIIPLIILSVIFLIGIIIIKIKSNNQVEVISNIESKNDSLTKRMEQLEEENENLENSISELSESKNETIDPGELGNTIHSSLGLSNGIAIVVFRKPSCDYFILENASGYIVAEWMGGNDPEVGAKITGDFDSYGIKEFYNQSSDNGSSLWIENYLLSKESAFEEIRDKCK